MNKRLLAYLRSLGLAADSTNEESESYFRGLRGNEAIIANLLNINDADNSARTASDLAIRSLGFDPANPSELLESASTNEPTERGNTTITLDNPITLPEDSTIESTLRVAGSNGASLPPFPLDEAAIRAQAVAEVEQRRSEIEEYGEVAGIDHETVREAVNNRSLSAADARRQFLEAHRTRQQGIEAGRGGPGIHIRNSQTDFNRDALACALMVGHGGIEDPAEHWRKYEKQTGTFTRAMSAEIAGRSEEIQRARDRGYELRSLTIADIMSRAMALDGIKVENNPQSVIAELSNQRAAMSTSVLQGTFTQAYGAVLLEAYDRAEDESLEWTKIGSAPNFMRQERVRMGKTGALTKHGAGKTADHMDISDVTEYLKIFRYSGKFVIDEMDIINNSFGGTPKMQAEGEPLMQHMPDEMGEAAKELKPDLVFAILFANPTMSDGTALFHADHGNIVTGGVGPTSTGIEAAVSAIRLQQERGRTLNFRGKHLIVPAEREFRAVEATASTKVVSGSTTARGELNAISRAGLNVLGSARLSSGVTDPDSGTSYAGDQTKSYMATDRGKAGIEVDYLAGGSNSPEVRSGLSKDGSGQWCIEFDTKMDIGAAATGFQGLCRIDD